MNLQTNYLGISLKNPLMISSCPLSAKIDNIKAIEDAGAAAIVMYSIFEEEIRDEDEEQDYYLHYGTNQFAEAITYFPNIDEQKSYLESHLYHLEQAVIAVKIPIIGSLNAVTNMGWLDYALRMQDTGIAALELNLQHNFIMSKAAAEIEEYYLDIVQKLKSKIRIPLVIKLSPFFTSIPNMVLKLRNAGGVDGIVMFNRFYYPDFNICDFTYGQNIQLSNPYEARLSLKWIATLYNSNFSETYRGNEATTGCQGGEVLSYISDEVKKFIKLPLSIAGSTGVNDVDDLIKYLLAGADVVMCASCVMRYGISHIKYLLKGLENWLADNNYGSIKEIQGLMSNNRVANPEEMERMYYRHALKHFANKVSKY